MVGVSVLLLALALAARSGGDRDQADAPRSTTSVVPTTLPVDTASCGAYRAPHYEGDRVTMETKAYFSCDADEGRPFAVYRVVPRSARVLEAAVRVLLDGPTPSERAAGLGSWFSTKTSGMVRSVTMRDGHAIVDFADLRPVIPNASTSAGSARLLAELDATVFQFSSVTSVEYRIDGSCETFTEWLQFGGCELRTRRS